MAAEYSQGRDYISAAKINYFHHFLKQLTGYTLHPQINTEAHPCRIADLGTQTAIWPIHVAEDSTLQTQVDAFDISDKFFPPSAWLPDNVQLHLHDIFEPFPEQFRARYDVVHLRLFLSLSTEQIHRALQNAVDILKPGGYVQWTEHDKTNLELTAVSPELSTKAAEALIAVEKNPFPNYDPSWVLEIAPAMAASGLEVVAEDQIQTRPSMLSQMNELHLLAMMDVPPGLSETIDEFKEKHLPTLIEDNQKGVSTIDGFLCVLGKKRRA